SESQTSELTAMEVIVMIHQHKVTIFSPAEESSTMVERLVEGILKWPPVQQWLYTDKQLLGDSMTLAECRYSCQMAPLKAPVKSHNFTTGDTSEL
uniref:Ubiquitin-like domain-containing protein n=1 Tax=Ursus maritimus TaxID=29073 RepID=A0A452UY05_URSMA